MMKRIIILLPLIIIFQNVFSQTEDKDFYITFDYLSNKIFNYEIGNGKIGTEKVYIKEFQKNGDINFYIRKELFTLKSKTKEIDSCRIEHLKNIKISDIKDLKKEVNKINALYPYKVYPSLYLVEKINDSTIVKYKVKWEYYIE